MKTNIKGNSIGICVSKGEYIGLCNLIEKRIHFVPEDVTFIRFKQDDIDFENRSVKGEKFRKDIEDWVDGIFPFPDVVYIQCTISLDKIKKIENIIGPYVFNSFIFNKWEGWKLLNNSWRLRKHLPKTQLIKDIGEFFDFINKNKFNDIIIKPINGYSSEGIYRIRLQGGNNIKVSSRQGETIKDQVFINYSQLSSFIESKIYSESHIVQQTIDTVKINENVIDIKMHMTRDYKGNWQVSLLLFRIANNNSMIIPTNITAYNMEQFIKSPIYNKAIMTDIEDSIKSLGFKICKSFDKSKYHIGDISIDLGLDYEGKLWIFEVNPLPFPTRGSTGEYPLKRPIEYALYLASRKNQFNLWV
ncbi:YheC/YheD family protein [Cytobacillus firmus]|uniref:YheC/YheD family protein n=1 Tax=Cytobacillus firmus TaxID=1399 RepID=UPI0021624633|nr:YheC/YheD family protein [Cytobacillus firmus]MCS0673863.1 YheC/YheD family protein [Cytobacillus firmus]